MCLQADAVIKRATDTYTATDTYFAPVPPVSYGDAQCVAQTAATFLDGQSSSINCLGFNETLTLLQTFALEANNAGGTCACFAPSPSPGNNTNKVGKAR